MRAGGDTLDAVIAGVNIVELDPRDSSVGYGGLPDEDGVVETRCQLRSRPLPARFRRFTEGAHGIRRVGDWYKVESWTDELISPGHAFHGA